MKLRVAFAIWLYALAATPAAAQVKVSDLPAASTLTGPEVMPGVQSSTSKKISVSQIGTYVAGDPTVIAAVRSGIPDATTGASGLESAADKTKLDGIATGATANSSDATLLNRANHTGTQSADTLTDGTTNKAFLATERTKLAGIATGATANTGTVTSASVTTANGISGSVATATTTPAITLTLGAITPSSVAASGTVTGSNLSGTNTGDQTSVTGNAGNITGTLAVAQGGTGATAVTGTGNNVLSASPTLTGTLTAATITASGAVTGSNLSGTHSGTSSGTNSGDQTITLTSDVTGSGTGSFATTITAGAVTLAKQANVASGTIFYRKTAAAGAPEVQTLATLKTDLGLTGTNSGDQTSVTGNAGTATALATGRTLAMTGDVTWTSPTFDGTSNVTAASTLANTTVTPGTYNLSTITVDAKGRITSASNGSGGTATLADGNYGDVTSSGSGTALTVNAGAITLAKQANVATGTVFYRKTAATGAPEVQTLATLKADLGLTGTNSGDSGTVTSVSVTTANGVSGTVATATSTPAITLALGAITPTSVAASGTVTGSNLSGTHAGTSSGTNTGDQTITLTGAVSGGGTGSFATTLGTNVVGLANMAQVATGSVFYRKTAATGNPEVQTLATLKTDLGLTGTNSGDQTTITGNAGTATALATGRTIAMTGDVAWTSPAFDGTGNVTAAGTIQAGVVTNAKLANVATATFKGRVTAATGSPEDLTGTQATTLLDVATGSLKGLMSSSDFTKLAGIASGATANTGTVTSVAALTLGTAGTDLGSSVATGTTTPVITLNVPTASAANRGALSSTDWSTFNGKQAALVSGTNIKTVGGATLLGSGDVGTVGVAYGGTGGTTATTALSNLGVVASTYTPTYTNNLNTTAYTAQPCTYQRIGAIISVACYVDVTVTGSGTTSIRLTLPVASNFTSAAQAAGTSAINITNNSQGVVLSDAATDLAQVNWVAGGSGTYGLTFIFQYQVL